MRSARGWLVVVVGGAGLGSVLAAAPGQAEAQAVGFTPTIGTLPEGVGMTVTPVVSADRRYVRLSVGAGFSAINSIQNLNIPLAAVGGGGGGVGPGAGAGFGPGGFLSPGVPMGMDGPVGPGSGFEAYPPDMMGSNGSFGGGMPVGPTAARVGDGSWYPAPRRSKTSRSKSARPKPPTPRVVATTPPKPAR